MFDEIWLCDRENEAIKIYLEKKFNYEIVRIFNIKYNKKTRTVEVQFNGYDKHLKSSDIVKLNVDVNKILEIITEVQNEIDKKIYWVDDTISGDDGERRM